LLVKRFVFAPCARSLAFTFAICSNCIALMQLRAAMANERTNVSLHDGESFPYLVEPD
jgi:hypothetical protein